ncbi:SH3 domain-containing protein [Pseudooctadecabacter sp.]|uniref:SH3 domain-containing protein n=1 Tax=Pseudooctadecabacter sp. TaxID=1966338 RepID=UPI0025CF07D1|nr:SH3 domain-containing protein [Pseudooctadecabacter sp.]
MKTYVWVSFAFMGWAYYEVSGGADFAPEQPEVAVAEAETQAEPDIVTRAATPTLLSVSTSNLAPAPEAEEAVVVPVVAQATPAEPEIVEDQVALASAPVAEAPVDIREVASSRVNMRAGPGTNFDVIITLDGGTELEVLEVDDSGWANVATLDRGIEGWMAERLLTSPDA